MMNHKRNLIIFYLMFVALIIVAAVQAGDWSNPNSQTAGDKAGPLLLKHEANMTDLYTGANSKLNLLKNNSASASAPASPSTGQGWYDLTNKYFKLYDATWGGGGFYSSVTSSLYNVYTAGTITAAKFVGPLTGNADSSTNSTIATIATSLSCSPMNSAGSATSTTSLTGIAVTNGDVILVYTYFDTQRTTAGATISNAIVPSGVTFTFLTGTMSAGTQLSIMFQTDQSPNTYTRQSVSGLILIGQTGTLSISSTLQSAATLAIANNNIGYVFLKKQ